MEREVKQFDRVSYAVDQRSVLGNVQDVARDQVFITREGKNPVLDIRSQSDVTVVPKQKKYVPVKE